MENVRPKQWSLLALVVACAAVLLTAEEALAQTNSSPSWWSFSKPATPTIPASQEDDPIALKNKKEPGAELYVAVARLYVESNKFQEAEEQYQAALKKFPDDLRVLLGYAVLKDQLNQPQDALKFYQQAEKKHPKEPSVYNNLAVHYAKWDMVREAIGAAQRAVDLRPREPRYRNNLAALMVEANLPQEAFKQLREVYDEPIAHYDLGFLLNKRGMKGAALQEFTIALRLSPGMVPARQWVERLSRERSDSQSAVGMMPARAQAPTVVVPNPAVQREELPPAPLAPVPPQVAVPQQVMAPQQNVAPQQVAAPQQYGAPPQYAVPPQNVAARDYANPAPPPAQVQYPAQGPYPQIQYPAQPQVAGPQNAGSMYAPRPAMMPGPQNAAPQNAGPQYSGAPQYSNSAPAANALPLMAARDPQATGVRVLPPPPAGDGNALRRLPPVGDQQGPDLVAPNPPDWRR